MGHTQWIEEVFANLISNAIKYMGKDNPVPSITITGFQIHNLVRYEVRDTGVGISPKDQAHLFEMFTRLHTVEADGLGLGLSIVRRIISKLNGQLGVESERGKGSAFWFTIPAALSSAGLPAPE
jgi:signal transduction histidine kinase